MNSKSLQNAVKSAATETFTRVLGLVSEVSSYYADRQRYGTRPPSLGKKLWGLVLASPESSEWAQVIRERFAMEFGSVYPDTELELVTIELQSHDFLMYSALLSHPAITGEDKERFSFVITPGHTEAEVMAEVREALNLSISQLYCVTSFFGTPFCRPRRGLAGVYNTPMTANEYANALGALLPNLKNVCLAYTPQPDNNAEHNSLQAQRTFISAALAGKGVEVSDHLWDFKNAYEGGLRTTIGNADALITLDEPAAARHRKKIVELCGQAQTLFCSSDLDSVFKGAGLGCGITKDAYIKPMIRVLHDLLTQQDGYVNSYQIPVQIGMRYNWEAMQAQGVVIPESVAALMRMKSVFDGDVIRVGEE